MRRSGWICRGSKVRDSVEVKLYEHEGETVCAGQKRRPAGEGDRHPAQAAGALAAQAAGDAHGVCPSAISC